MCLHLLSIVYDAGCEKVTSHNALAIPEFILTYCSTHHKVKGGTENVRARSAGRRYDKLKRNNLGEEVQRGKGIS
jgi:hypothetical protein